MEKAFGNIIVPYDNSPNSKRALTKAFSLAGITDATVTLIHVINYQKAMAKIVQPYKGTMLDYVEKFFNQIERDASRRNIRIKTKILYGNPSEEILNFMKNKRFDLVVVGRRGTTKITGPSLGSVSNALVQTSKVPILVVT